MLYWSYLFDLLTVKYSLQGIDNLLGGFCWVGRRFSAPQNLASEHSIYTVGQSQLWTHLDVAVPEADGGDVSAVRVSALYTRDARVQLRGEVTHARLPGAVPQPHNLNTAVRIII